MRGVIDVIINFLLMLASGVLGLTSHWFKRWVRGQTRHDFVVYLCINKAATWSSVVTMVASVFALAPSADMDLTMQALGNAFMAGYMIDSALNKDQP